MKVCVFRAEWLNGKRGYVVQPRGKSNWLFQSAPPTPEICQSVENAADALVRMHRVRYGRFEVHFMPTEDLLYANDPDGTRRQFPLTDEERVRFWDQIKDPSYSIPHGVPATIMDGTF